jgi:hypothetical protein
MNTYTKEYYENCYKSVIQNILKSSETNTMNDYIQRKPNDFGDIGYDVDLIKHHI